MENKYPRTLFRKRLNDLRKEVEEMGLNTQKTYRNAISAFISYDDELVHKVIETNQKVSEISYQIEQKAMQIIASEQPVAMDLRFIEATIKVSGHLKRISALAANIADVARQVKDEEVPKRPMEDLQHMADIVEGMISKSMAAFLGQNMNIARELHRDDDKVDDLFDKAMKNISKSMIKDKEAIPYLIYILSVARFLERIADRAENIGNRTIFMITCEKP